MLPVLFFHNFTQSKEWNLPIFRYDPSLFSGSKAYQFHSPQQSVGLEIVSTIHVVFVFLISLLFHKDELLNFIQ